MPSPASARPIVSYPLAALQPAMLVNYLREPRSSGTDIVQMVSSLPEAVDAEAMRAAWATVTARHDALRTAFRWADVAEPVQDVWDAAPPPVAVLDWSDASDEDEVAARMRAFLAEDRAAGFDLATPPLQRVMLMRVADDDWRMVWTFHHILMDGRSFTIVMREVFAEYDARGAAPSRLSPGSAGVTAAVARRPYRDFVAWYNDKDFAPAEAYWRERLRGFPGATPLPASVGGADEPRTGRALQQRWLRADATAAVERMARASGVTMNTVVQGAWALLLARHARVEDVTFGATRACRKGTIEGIDDIVGLHINTVPVRVAVPQDQPLGTWLGTLRETWRSLFDVEHTPLRLIQRWLGVSSAAGQSLFDTQVVYENGTLQDAMRAEGGRMAARSFWLYGSTGFGATLLAFGGRELSLEIDHSREALDEPTARRVLDQLATLLESMGNASPETLVGDLSMVPSDELPLLLGAWNDTSANYPQDATIHGLIESQVRARPDAIALEMTADGVRQTVTYAELDAQANRVAAALRAAGVRVEDRVALVLERSLAVPAAILGVLKAGAAYVPIDPAYPDDRVAYTIEDAGTALVITEAAQHARLASLAGSATLLDVDTLLVSDAAVAEMDPVVVTPDNVAYVIYTSGSTGRPKGVMVEHRNVTRLLVNDRSRFDFDTRDVWTVFHSFSFDFSVWELYGALVFGGRAVIVPRAVAQSPSDFLSLLESSGTTVLNQVPSAFYGLMNEALARATQPELAVRYVIFGGEALKPALLREFRAAYPSVQPINMFGITETTVHVTYKAIGDAEIAAGASNIGGPIPTLTTHLCDDGLRLVPVGVIGEICVGGLGVARGYLNRPVLTAERFVADPFGGPGGRLYRSGDLGRRLPNGEIEYLGRKDHQVKVRGHRIELGEIEAALTQHPQVTEAVVLARADDGGDQRLVAYIVATDGERGGRGERPSVTALREHVLTTLPEYMVPAAFVWLPAMPLTGNGKVDRKALPAPEVTREAVASAYVAPRTDVERVLADVWAAALRVGRVGVEDNFFELGGDSLLCVQIVARAAKQGVRVTLTQVLRNPTVAALARVAQSAPAVRAAAAQDELPSAPLTPIEQWFFEGHAAGVAADGVHHWNQAFLFTVPGDMDAARLASALTAVTRQHDSLRLRFTRDGGAWRQSVAAEVPDAEVEVVAPADAGATEPMMAACERAQASLDIERGPLMRAVLLRNENGAGRLLLAVHHLAIDGVSWRVLREDVEAAYRGEPLPRRTTPFSRWATRLVQEHVAARAADELPYWESVGSPPSVRVPRDVDSTDAGVAADADMVVARLDEAETRALLQAVPAAYNTQINDALLAALSEAFTTWMPASAGMTANDLVVNLEGHGREDVLEGADLSRTMGWFTTIYPVRLPLGTADVATRIKSTKELLRAVPNRGIGYGLLRYLGGADTLRAQTTPDVVFNYLGQFDAVCAGSTLFGMAGEPTGAWYGARTPRRHLLEVNALVLDGKLEVRWSYSTKAHHRETIERVANAYAAALRAVVAHCTTPGVGGYTPSDFPLARLDQATLDRVVGAVAGTSRDVEDVYPAVPMQRLFLGYADPATDPGFEQWRFRLRGALDRTALWRAWKTVVARHAILRTAFVSEGLAEPLQVVRRDVALPWTEHDLRGVAHEEQVRRLNAILAADRREGFAFDRAPLMRITIVRLADDLAELVWSNHHLLLDRWSWPLILKEMRALYPALARDESPALPGAPRYGDLIAWQQRQPVGEARSFWARHFDAFDAPPRLAMTRPDADASVAADEARVDLSVEASAAVTSFARARHVAPNAVIAGAWALWLARHLGHGDVSFGMSVAGRDGEVPGVERMVGLALNNLPVRVRVDAGADRDAWLADVHAAQAEVQQFAHVPLEQVQEWSGVPWRTRLFETLVVFQHDDAETSTAAWLGDDVTTQLVHVPTHTAYPLSVIVAGSAALSLRVTFDPRYFDRDAAQRMAEGLRAALDAIVRAPESTTLGALLATLPEPPVTAAAGAARAYVAPRTATENVIARVWEEVLGAERVGVSDDFFALGGYSLVATQIVSRLRSTLQVDVPVRLLFQHPSVAALATALSARERTPGRLEKVAQVVLRVQAMSLDELRSAGRARAVTN